MTDRLSHLKLAMDVGFQLGQGKKVDLSEMADKHLTKECPRCQGHGEIPEGGETWEDTYCVQHGYATRETRGCDNYDECPDCEGTGRVPKDGTDE